MPHNTDFGQKRPFKIPLLFQGVKSKSSYSMERGSRPFPRPGPFLRGQNRSWRISHSAERRAGVLPPGSRHARTKRAAIPPLFLLLIDTLQNLAFRRFDVWAVLSPINGDPEKRSLCTSRSRLAHTSGNIWQEGGKFHAT